MQNQAPDEIGLRTERGPFDRLVQLEGEKGTQVLWSDQGTVP